MFHVSCSTLFRQNSGDSENYLQIAIWDMTEFWRFPLWKMWNKETSPNPFLLRWKMPFRFSQKYQLRNSWLSSLMSFFLLLSLSYSFHPLRQQNSRSLDLEHRFFFLRGKSLEHGDLFNLSTQVLSIDSDYRRDCAGEISRLESESPSSIYSLFL